MKIDENAVFSQGPGLIELIMKARKEAVARGIEADSIVINANMVYVPALFGERPEMICGLDVHVTKDELPDRYSFAVLHNCNKEAKSQWIPVTERLPEFHKEVLTRSKMGTSGHFFSVAELGMVDDELGWLFDDGFEPQDIAEITHWMPLPEPPKGD